MACRSAALGIMRSLRAPISPASRSAQVSPTSGSDRSQASFRPVVCLGDPQSSPAGEESGPHVQTPSAPHPHLLHAPADQRTHRGTQQPNPRADQESLRLLKQGTLQDRRAVSSRRLRPLSSPVKTPPEMSEECRNKIDMWKLTLVLNVAIAWFVSLGSAIFLVSLRYADSAYARFEATLPAPSRIALSSSWLLWVVPLSWTVITLALLIWHRKTAEASRDMVQLHTSATLLIGIMLLAFFSAAGLMPFFKLYELIPK
jgi:hypothetical protein